MSGLSDGRLWSSSRTALIRRQASLIAVGGDSVDVVVLETTGGGVGVTTVVGTGGVVAGVGDGTDNGVGHGGGADALVVVVGCVVGSFGVALGMVVLVSRGQGVAATRA